MNYQTYLKSAHWQKVRRAALKRAGLRCQICNESGVQLDVHHRTYERLGNEFDSDLTVLCNSCHGKFHDRLPAPPVEESDPFELAPDIEKDLLKTNAQNGLGRWVELAWYKLCVQLGMSPEDAIEDVSKSLNQGGHRRRVSHE